MIYKYDGNIVFESREPSKLSRVDFMFVVPKLISDSVRQNSLNVFDEVQSWKPEDFFRIHFIELFYGNIENR